jgi:Fur family transcriptional regulator, ferric uptake regulator
MDKMRTNPTREDWLHNLQKSGYRLTGPRRVIAEIMINSDRALEPLEVFDLGRQEYPGLGLVTVYRTLEKFEELGLVERVHQPDGCHRYLRAAQGHEHLLLCTGCGQAVYFSGDDLDELMDLIAQRSGYAVHDHLLQMFGRCADCQAHD